ncbi:hypothetical protein JHD47_05425 [Sulfurimonas sp. SAG-AH-194-L11]|nr:hypothetical protein [Sulfurimonas sp. SAG-AH-194-L11]MDF1877253.1 hypothetical protein [Sulfurimonas sp. SAG-AH-194-L11]
MEREIKVRLEEVVALLNDTEETVMENEIKEKLEKILALLNDPKEIELDKKKLHDRLTQVLELVNNAMVDPDIEIEYCIPDEKESSSSCDIHIDPYILVTYVISEYNKPTRKIRLRDTALRRNTPESIANQVTFSIEEFKGEIDSVQMG